MKSLTLPCWRHFQLLCKRYNWICFAHSRVGDKSANVQAQVDLDSDSSSDSHSTLSRAAILQAQADALRVPTDVSDDDEKYISVKPKLAVSYQAFPPCISSYDQQSQSCGLFTQYRNYIGQARDVTRSPTAFLLNLRS